MINNLLNDQKVLKAFLFITYRKRKGIQVVIKFFITLNPFFFFLRNYLKKKTENLFFIDNLIWSYILTWSLSFLIVTNLCALFYFAAQLCPRPPTCLMSRLLHINENIPSLSVPLMKSIWPPRRS